MGDRPLDELRTAWEGTLPARFGGPEVLHLGEVPELDAGPGQIRVRVEAAGLNAFDGKVRSGAMEAAFCVLALTEGFMPGNPHLVSPDPVCESLDLPRAAVETAPGIVLNNSSGFGGSNVCHVLREFRA